MLCEIGWRLNPGRLRSLNSYSKVTTHFLYAITLDSFPKGKRKPENTGLMDKYALSVKIQLSWTRNGQCPGWTFSTGKVSLDTPSLATEGLCPAGLSLAPETPSSFGLPSGLQLPARYSTILCEVSTKVGSLLSLILIPFKRQGMQNGYFVWEANGRQGSKKEKCTLFDFLQQEATLSHSLFSSESCLRCLFSFWEHTSSGRFSTMDVSLGHRIIEG